jgi:hypothetical protein
MNDQEIYNALKTLLNRIKGATITWYLEGSVNLFVQGVPVIPKDIDITTNDTGLDKFRTLLKKEIIKESYIKENKAHLLKCKIEDHEIEIAVYEEEDKNSFSTMQVIPWKDLFLPTQRLSVALQFYKRINRQDKVQLLENFLSLQTRRSRRNKDNRVAAQEC